MNDKVLMTAVITTFNNEKTITATLNSILKQKLPIKQLVIVDDSSVDKTIKKIKKTFKKEISKGIINLIINKKNHGVATVLYFRANGRTLRLDSRCAGCEYCRTRIQRRAYVS